MHINHQGSLCFSTVGPFRPGGARPEPVRAGTGPDRPQRACGSTNPQAKGEVLEPLMAAVFSIKPHLQVIARNFSTGDEEIDVILKNNVARPF